MTTKTKGDCATCGYPIAASYEGESVTCPYCKTINIAQKISGASGTLLALIIGIGIGTVAGSAIIAATEGGREWLEKQTRERIK